MRALTITGAAAGIAIALVVVAVVLVRLPGAEKSPALDRTDLLADIRRFALGLSTKSGYVRPSHPERMAVGDGVRHVLNGRPLDARKALARVGYAIHKRIDTATERAFYEIADAAARPRGWGRILVDLGTSVHFGIEVPHPKADVNSEALGVELFRRVPGSVLVIAGAHRRAAPDRQADMAHTTESVFQTVHELLMTRRLPVVQLHGFQNETAPDSDVVVSAGPELHSPYVDRLARRLESAGLSVCWPWVTGCRDLAGTTNVQARWVAAHGGEFAHIEVSRDTRDTAESRDRVVSALTQQVVGQ